MFGRAAFSRTASLLARSTRQAGMIRSANPLAAPLQPASTLLMDKPRYFAKGKGKGGKKGDRTALRYVWGEFDLDDDDIEPEEILKFVPMPKGMDQVRKRLIHEIGLEGDDSLEYFKNNEWLELTSVDQLKGGSPKKPILIRNPKQYADGGPDDEYDFDGVEEFADDEQNFLDDDMEKYDGSDDYDDDMDAPPPFHQSRMQLTILEIVEELLNEGSSLESGDTLKMSDGTTISTKEFVMKEAQDDKSLQDMLLSVPGALDHIAQVSQERSMTMP